MCGSGNQRRTWLRGRENVQKRYLLTAAARNLGLLMLHLFGIGTPRGLQGSRAAALFAASVLALLASRLRAVASDLTTTITATFTSFEFDQHVGR